MQKLPFDLMAGAGWAKTIEHVRRLAAIPYLTHIVAGSFTLDSRAGNTGGTNFDVLPDGTSTNSLGMPNGGGDYLLANLKEMVEIAHGASKKFVLNVAGFTWQEQIALITIAIKAGVDIIEENWGCPNVYGADKVQKGIISYVREAMMQFVSFVEERFGASIERWIKVSPTSNPADRVWIADLFAKSSATTLVATNTFPNVYLTHGDGRPLLQVANGYGGMAGTALHWVAVSNARHYDELLRPHPDKKLIGSGGNNSYETSLDFLRIGQRMSGVQVSTAFFHREDPRVFRDIAEGWAAQQA